MKIISYLLVGLAAFLFGKEENKSFVHHDYNVIQYTDQNLVNLVSGLKNNTLPIYHIGDSHIQIGEFSKGFLTALQNKNYEIEKGWFLPNLIFPELNFVNRELRSFEGEVTCNNLKEFNKNLELGLSGRTFSFTSNKASLDFNFNKEVKLLKILHQDRPFSLMSSEKSIVKTEKLNSGLALTSIEFSKEIKKVKLKLFQESGQNVEFYAIKYLNKKTENSNNTYSNFGVSGGRFSQLLDSKLLYSQIKSLEPGLFVLTLGTNDSYAEDFNAENLKIKLVDFIKNSRELSPKSRIIIMSSPDTFYEGQRPKHLEKVNEIVQTLCQEYQVGFWDWYAIMGGKNSIHEWSKNKLVSDDLLHFNSNGYSILGKLFAEALLKL